MTAVGKTATVSLSKDSRLKFSEGNVAHNAWAAWKVGQAIAARRGTPMTRDGILGYEHQITMVEVLLTAFPELRVVHRDEMDSMTGTIRDYLRQTGNAHCTQKDPAKGIRWWLRAEWNDTPHALVHGGLALTSRERRLTSAEAGEDRSPAPVTTRKVDPPQKATPDLVDRILGVLTDYEGPLSRAEVGSLLDPPVPIQPLRRTLKDLVASGHAAAWSGTDCGRPLLRAGGRYYTPPTWAPPEPEPAPPKGPAPAHLVDWPEAKARAAERREKVARWLEGRKRPVTTGDAAKALKIPSKAVRNALEAMCAAGTARHVEVRGGKRGIRHYLPAAQPAPPVAALVVVAEPVTGMDGISAALAKVIDEATAGLRAETARLRAENDALRSRLAQLIPVDQLLGGPQ